MDDSWADEAPVAKAARREQASLWEARPGASAPALTHIKLGTRVVVHGLASMSEQSAHVVSLPTAEQARVGVVLRSGKSILVKPENLKASMFSGDFHEGGAS